MEREGTREHSSPSETLACAATAGPTPWLPEARWALAGRRETGPHGRWRHGGPQILGTGCPGVPSMDVLSPWSSGWASPPIHPAKWLQRQRPQSPRPRRSGTAASVEHVVSPLPSPRTSLPILWRRWRSAADAVSRRQPPPRRNSAPRSHRRPRNYRASLRKHRHAPTPTPAALDRRTFGQQAPSRHPQLNHAAPLANHGDQTVLGAADPGREGARVAGCVPARASRLGARGCSTLCPHMHT
jgi:hypothetical protein